MQLEFDGKTMKQRIMNRARYVGVAVFLSLSVCMLIVLFLAANDIINLNIGFGFALQGFGLSLLVGLVVAFVYYVISGWMFLGE